MKMFSAFKGSGGVWVRRVEHFVLRVRSIVIRELFEGVGLGCLQKCPELVFGDEVLGVRDVGLFEHAVAVLADEEIRDVLLEG